MGGAASSMGGGLGGGGGGAISPFGQAGGGLGGGGMSDGGVSNWWKKSDPYDLSGQQSKARSAQAEKQIEQNRARMQELFDKQPKYNAKTNAYAGQLDQRLGGIGDVNSGGRYKQAGRATDQLSQRAFGTEDSPWLKMQLQQQELGQSQAGDQLAQGGALQQQQQFDNMAMQGGLGQGSRERLGQANMRSQMEQQQQLSRQGQMDRLGLRSQEEQQKFQLQQQMPQMQLGLDQYQTGLGQQNRNAAFNKTSMWQGQANQDQQTRLQNQQYKQNQAQQAWQQKMAAEGGLSESAAMLRSGNDVGINRYKVGGMGLGGFGSGGLM